MEEREQQDGGCGCLVVDCGVEEMKIAEVVESDEEQGRLLMIGSNRVVEVEQKRKGGSRQLLPGAWERETRGTGKDEGLVVGCGNWVRDEAGSLGALFKEREGSE
ncbi:hypothetical protein AMTRI_Chr10g2880 [Amborella trichopoda]